MIETPTQTCPRGHETSAINVVLVDEQLVVTEAMRTLFDAEPDFHVVGSACDPHEAARLVEAHRPDVVVASLTGRALIRLVNRLRYHPGTAPANDAKLVVLTAATEKSGIFRAFHRGIAATLSRQTSPQQLFDNVRSIVAGRESVGAASWAAGASGLHDTDALDTLPSVLTPRELQIVESVGRGDTNKAIARQFAIGPETVKRHLTRIYDKLGLSNRLQLAVYALNPMLSERLEDGVFPPAADYRTH